MMTKSESKLMAGENVVCAYKVTTKLDIKKATSCTRLANETGALTNNTQSTYLNSDLLHRGLGQALQPRARGFA